VIASIRYKGVLIAESGVPGEGKAEGMTPNYAEGIQVGRDRWLLAYDTVDARGRDCWRSIFYQIRAHAPDGPIVKEGVVSQPRAVGQTRSGARLWRAPGQPQLFGVPAGALHRRRVRPDANLFGLTWMSPVNVERDGLLVHYDSTAGEAARSDDLSLTAGDDLTFHRELLQFRLTPSGDDIEIAAPPQPLTDADGQVARGWAAPIPRDEACSEWLEAVSASPPARAEGVVTSRGGTISIVRYVFDPKSGLYVCRADGPRIVMPADMQIGEQALARMGEGDFVIAARLFNQGGRTVWLRTEEGGRSLAIAAEQPDTYGQRYAFRCADGVVRMVQNNQTLSPHKERRNPLYCWDVDPADLAYRDQRVVADAHAMGLSFHDPFLDHTHLFPPCGGRQLISFRVITARQVWNDADKFPAVTPHEWERSGIHCAEIVYDRECASAWEFAS